ncbi:hypothetical protein NMG60_11008240 [Bertholletia excelsa]
MVWRWRWRCSWTLSYGASYRTVRILSLVPSRSLSLPIASAIYKNQKFYAAAHFQDMSEIFGTSVTPQTVHPTLQNCPSDLITLSFFLWCARQPGYFHERWAFDYIVNVVSRLSNRLRTVKEIIMQLESIGCDKKPQTFLLLLRIFWHGRNYNLVLEAFQEMVSCGYTPNTFAQNILMDVLFKIGNIDVALRVLKEMLEPNHLTFSIAICHLCKLNDLMNVQGLLRVMLGKRYYFNARKFSVVINCFCKSGRLSEGLQILAVMITLGLPISTTVWNILIDGFCKSHKLVMASYLLEKMIDTGFSPNNVTFTSLIKGLMESQMLSRAFCIISLMESMGCFPDLILCNVLIDCLSKMGRCNDALDVFFSLPKRRLVPDSYTLCSIISAICMPRRFALLPILISGLVIQPDLAACNSLMNYFCRAGYPSGAVEFYNDMIDMGFIPDGYTYAGLLRGLCGMGRIGEALDVYHGIVRNQFCSDPHIHTIITHALISSGKFCRAIKFFREVVAEKYPHDVVSYTVAIEGHFRGGQTEEACSLYGQMKEAGIAPNGYTYHVMLSNLCKEKEIEMVRQVLQEMIAVGISVNCNSFYMIRNLLFKLCYQHSAFNLFVAMSTSRLMTDKVLGALMLKGLDFRVGGGRPSWFKHNLAYIPEVGMFGPDDLYEVAA